MESDAWRDISGAAEAVAEVNSAVRALVLQLVGDADRVDESSAPGAVRTAAARDLAVEAGHLRHASDALAAVAAHLAESQEVWRDDAERSMRSWMARHLGISGRAANVDRRRAAVLAQLPEVAAAFAAGALTPGHLDAIANIVPARFRGDDLASALAHLAKMQDQLIEAAEWSTVDHFAGFCRLVRDRVDTDGTPPDDAVDPGSVDDPDAREDGSAAEHDGAGGGDGARRDAGSWLSVRELSSGRYRVDGELSPDDGAVWRTLVEERMVRDRTRRADAGDPADDRPYEERLAAAAHSLLLDGAAATRPGRIGIFLHVDLDTYVADAVRAQPDLGDLFQKGRAHTEAGIDVTDETLYAWLAGEAADVTPIFERGGTPLSYGRSRRIAPDELRRAIAHRDRTCAFPNCDSPFHRNHAHHLEEWREGGTTDPENVAGTCVANHLDHVHARGWRLRRAPSGRIEALRPDGTVFDPTPRWQQPRSRHRRPDAEVNGSAVDVSNGCAA